MNRSSAWLSLVFVLSAASSTVCAVCLVGCGHRDADEGATSALESDGTEDDMTPLHRGDLPTKSKLRLQAKSVNDGWTSNDAVNGDGRVASGVFSFTSRPSDTRLIVSAQRILEEYAAEQQVELAGPVDGWAQTSNNTLDGQIADVAHKIAVEAFKQEDSEANVTPVRDQVASVVALMGAPEDVGIVHSQTYAKVDGSPDGRPKHLTMTLFVNLKTGEFVSFIAREGWI